MAYYKSAMRRSSKTAPGKYYPTAVSVGRVTTDELCDEIEEISTVNAIDIVAVLKALNTVIGRHLAAGQTVQLKVLCNVRLTAQSKGAGVATPEEVSAEQISGYRVVFAAERQSGPANGKDYSLDLSRLRWQPLPGSVAGGTTPSGGGDTPTPQPDEGNGNSGSGSGSGGSNPPSGGNDGED